LQAKITASDITEEWIFTYVPLDSFLIRNAADPIPPGVAVQVTACQNRLESAFLTVDGHTDIEGNDGILDSWWAKAARIVNRSCRLLSAVACKGAIDDVRR
jgi:hypothetical protein